MSTRIIQGDCRAVMATLPAESVHCTVTSPPYFGLRDYGVDGQIGLEPTLAEYIATMVEVFRAVKRVLRSDGCVFLNLGDSYQDKQLQGVPWRVAFALQGDGWILRQDIIWAKENPMPESITDRCTKAHEYIFLLSKSARYYFDADAIKEDAGPFDPRATDSTFDCHVPGRPAHAGLHRAGLHRGRASGNKSHKFVTAYEASDTEEHRTKAGLLDARGTAYAKRNKRSVWTVASEPFKSAHFATFPTALIEPAILAGTSAKGVCSSCGAPWRRVMSKEPTGARQKMADGWDTGEGAHGTIHRDGRQAGERDVPVMASVTTGWAPGCACNAAVVPATVLDCFFGAGTTGLVCDRLQRDCIGVELNPTYAAMARARIEGDATLFAQVTPEAAE